MSIDKREHARYPVEVAGEIEIRGEMVGVSTQNLSRGGVGLLLDQPLEEGTKLTVTLFLTQDGIEDPDEDPFEAEGAVRWVAENDQGLHILGVQFTSLDPAQMGQLERFLTVVQG